MGSAQVLGLSFSSSVGHTSVLLVRPGTKLNTTLHPLCNEIKAQKMSLQIRCKGVLSFVPALNKTPDVCPHLYVT